VKRRHFLTLIGGAALASPLGARAQQKAPPVIGYLSGRPPAEAQYLVDAFEKGLREGGFFIGQNVAIEFRWADNQYDRLPTQATDLVSRPVALIAASGAVQAIEAAKAATSAIPIVFVTGDDPVRLGLVVSLNRPGGNVTGFPRSPSRWKQSGWTSCTSSYPRPRSSPCWRTETIRAPHCN